MTARRVGPETSYEEWAEEAREAFEIAGFERVSVEPSNVTRSPYKYLYVYLSDRGIEGPHALVSQDEEYDEDSTDLCVGVHDDLDDFEERGGPDVVPDLPAAVAYVRREVAARYGA